MGEFERSLLFSNFWKIHCDLQVFMMMQSDSHYICTRIYIYIYMMPDIQNIHFRMVGYQKDDEPNHALFYMKNGWKSPYPSIWKWTAFMFQVYIHSDLPVSWVRKLYISHVLMLQAKPCQRWVQETIFLLRKKKSHFARWLYWRVSKNQSTCEGKNTTLTMGSDPLDGQVKSG